jgi:transposase InsO family protein
MSIHHDQGGQFISSTYQKELRFLGIKNSPIFVRKPQGNGTAERFVRTLKENFLWIRRFATVEELRLALLKFKNAYKHKWMVGRHGYKTPAQVRAAQTLPLPKAA